MNEKGSNVFNKVHELLSNIYFKTHYTNLPLKQYFWINKNRDTNIFIFLSNHSKKSVLENKEISYILPKRYICKFISINKLRLILIQPPENLK